MTPSLIEAVLRVFRAGGDGPEDDLTDAELRRVAPGVRRLREGLTGARELIGTLYMADSELAAAYLLYHLPLNVARARSVLAEVALPTGDGPVRILDVGAGPGSLAFGALESVAAEGRAARVLVTDAVSEALALAGDLAAVGGLGGRLGTARWRLPETPPSAVRRAAPFDWILAGNILNELDTDMGTDVADAGAPAARADWIVGTIAPLLAPHGRIVVIEPALRETSRALLALRDALLERGMVVLAPCLVQSACPALEKRKDWCHQARLWEQPELVRRLSDAASVDNERLNFSYLVLARAADGAPPAHSDDQFRIVSAPLPEKGKRVIWGCGPAGRDRLVRLDRHRTEANATFDDLDRGDIATLAPLARKGDGLRVGEDTAVARADEGRGLRVEG